MTDSTSHSEFNPSYSPILQNKQHQVSRGEVHQLILSILEISQFFEKKDGRFQRLLRNSKVFALNFKIFERCSDILLFFDGQSQKKKNMINEFREKNKNANNRFTEAKGMMEEIILSYQRQNLKNSQRIQESAQYIQDSNKEEKELRMKLQSIQTRLQQICYYSQQLKQSYQKSLEEYSKNKEQEVLSFGSLMIIREQILSLKRIGIREYYYNGENLGNRIFDKNLISMDFYHLILLDLVCYLLTELNLSSYNLLKSNIYNSQIMSAFYPSKLVEQVSNVQFKKYQLNHKNPQESIKNDKTIGIRINDAIIDILYEAFVIVLKILEKELQPVSITLEELIIINEGKTIIVQINPVEMPKRSLIIKI